VASGKNKEAVKWKELGCLFIYLKEKWLCQETKHPFSHCLPLDRTGYSLRLWHRSPPSRGRDRFYSSPVQELLPQKSRLDGPRMRRLSSFRPPFFIRLVYMLATHVQDINHLEPMMCYCLSLLRSAFIHRQKKTKPVNINFFTAA